MTGKFVWFDYVTSDAPKAQGFFGELFGWTTQQVSVPGVSYTLIATGGHTIGGYLAPPPGAPPKSHWLSHLEVTDARASAAQVTKLGGKVMKEPFALGEFGTMAVVLDPHGGALALWQAARPPEPKPAPAAGQFVWNELQSQDPAASVAFYRALGGFTDKAMELPGMGAYHLLESEGQSRAGILKPTMAGVPHAWLPYVQVANADASLAKAKRLGATVFVEATDTPGVGRFAVFADPQGGALGILQPA